MSKHDECPPDSRKLCDDLFQALSQRYHGLQRRVKKNYCTFNREGQKNLVYIEHRKTKEGIVVSFLDEVADPSEYPSLIIEPYKPGSAIAWGRFILRTPAQLPEAVKLIGRSW